MHPALIAADIAAITMLVLGIFLPRHQRRELVVAYLTVNVGVLAVAATLGANTTLSAGLGLGLFGVLSIIRLRSQELAQHEVAYYFAALALGLLGGLGSTSLGIVLGLMAMILLAVAVGDALGGSARTCRQTLVLDRAYGDRAALRAHVERVLGGSVHEITVVKTDLVNDTTVVDVRHTPAAEVAASSESVTR